jgi:hypothetical protein
MSEQPDDLWERAEADAAKIAPRPRIEPLTAGIAGGIGVFIALEIFSVLADLPRDRYGIAATVTCALGFGVPWLAVWLAERRHFTARSKAYDFLLTQVRLDAAEEARREARWKERHQ